MVAAKRHAGRATEVSRATLPVMSMKPCGGGGGGEEAVGGSNGGGGGEGGARL